MNRADRMLTVLLDGEPHSRAELHAAGGYYLTNNAAAELRARHYNVAQHRERIDGAWIYFYTLVELPEAEVPGTASASGSAAGVPGTLPPSASSALAPRLELECQPPSLDDDQQLTLLLEAA